MVFVICPYCRPSATMDVAEAAPAGAGADFETRLKTEVAEAAPVICLLAPSLDMYFFVCSLACSEAPAGKECCEERCEERSEKRQSKNASQGLLEGVRLSF